MAKIDDLKIDVLGSIVLIEYSCLIELLMIDIVEAVAVVAVVAAVAVLVAVVGAFEIDVVDIPIAD